MVEIDEETVLNKAFRHISCIKKTFKLFKGFSEFEIASQSVRNDFYSTKKSKQKPVYPFLFYE
ncbi:protein of unknown function [Chryseobacterium sp. JV274]|nr:protein of unknown function [Chryseobacterium sp. JV274]